MQARSNAGQTKERDLHADTFVGRVNLNPTIGEALGDEGVGEGVGMQVSPGCFQRHSHNIWSRNKVAKAMCAIRHAHYALTRRGNFTLDNIKLGGKGAAHEDPMGTLVGAMTVLKWNLNYQQLLEHNLTYNTRLLCATSLFMAHKLKSEDGWGVSSCMPMSTCVVMEFLSRNDILANTWTKQKNDVFALELKLLNETPVYSLVDENVQSATEVALTKMLAWGVINEEQAEAALRRVFIYFYATVVIPDRDVFEDAMDILSTGQMGHAMARTVLRGTPAYALLDDLPISVLAFSELLVECLETSFLKSCVDTKFLKEMYEAERDRVGVDYPRTFFANPDVKKCKIYAC